MSTSNNTQTTFSKPNIQKSVEVQPSQHINPFYYYVPNDQSTKQPKHESKQHYSRSRSRQKRKQYKHKHIHKSSYESNRVGRRTIKETNQTISKQQAYFKTKICPLYSQGTCRKGSSCNFAHGDTELKSLPNFKKTKLCIAFKQGKCGKPSIECKYAHGQSQLRKLKTQNDKKTSSSPRKDPFMQNLNMAYMIPSNVPVLNHSLQPLPSNNSIGNYGPIYPTSSYPPLYGQPLYYTNNQYDYGYIPPIPPSSSFYPPFSGYNPPV